MTAKCNHKYANNGMVKLTDPPLYQINCLVCAQILYVNEKSFDLTPLYKCNNFGKEHKIEAIRKGIIWCSVCGTIEN